MEIVDRHPRFKKRKIVLHQEPIVHDIDNLSYKLAEASLSGDIAVQDAAASDSEDGLDGNVISQYIAQREADLRKRLSFCLKERVILEAHNGRELLQDYEFLFELPFMFPDEQLQTAATLMHTYLVKGALRDWYANAGLPYGQHLPAELQVIESKIVDIFRLPEIVRKPSMIYMQSYRRR